MFVTALLFVDGWLAITIGEPMLGLVLLALSGVGLLVLHLRGAL